MLAAAASPAKQPPPKAHANANTHAHTHTHAHVHHKPVPPAVSSVSPDYTRLHITPLDADLLSVVLPASIRPDARNISFHSLASFPEKRYGFVDLPADAAVKLRRKLNGAVLKGVKLSIEPARQAPQDRYAQERADIAADMAKRSADEQALRDDEKRARRERKERSRQEKREKKEKRDKTRTAWDKLDDAKAKRQQLVGVQLDDRPVKRGWTEPQADADAAADAAAKRKYHTKEDKEQAKKERKDKKDKKDKKATKQREKSAYTDGPECLFKTILPASKVASASASSGKEPVGSDGEVDERAAKRQRRLDRKAREVVVHEFANWSRIPNFIKSAASSSAAPAAAANLEYVDGKGWVNADSGDVVEPLKSTRSNAVTAVITKEEQLAKRARFDARRAAAKLVDTDPAGAAVDAAADSETSDSGSDTSSDESSEDDEEEEEEEEEEEKEGEKEENDETESPSRPKSSGSAKSLTITIPAPPPPAAAAAPLTPAKVHPLEALYKRTAQDPTAAAATAAPAGTKPAAAPFSFFGDAAGDIEEEEDHEMHEMEMEVDATEPVAQPPMTPFTKQEFEWRNVRSAAPTPDTAHPAKTFWAADEDSEEEEGSIHLQEDKDKSKSDAATDFSAWFWDNRGDLNRSWKRRRKTAAKEKRYRENRARNERAI